MTRRKCGAVRDGRSSPLPCWTPAISIRCCAIDLTLSIRYRAISLNPNTIVPDTMALRELGLTEPYRSASTHGDPPTASPPAVVAVVDCWYRLSFFEKNIDFFRSANTRVGQQRRRTVDGMTAGYRSGRHSAPNRLAIHSSD
jgi:hypothetical protein